MAGSGGEIYKCVFRSRIRREKGEGDGEEFFTLDSRFVFALPLHSISNEDSKVDPFDGP